MTIVASDIISRVRTQIIDDGVSAGFRWTDTEILRYISDAQRAIVAAKPEASARHGYVDLVAGHRQSLPTAAYKFLGAIGNVDSTGTALGPVTEILSRQMFDVQRPGWLQETRSMLVKAVIPPEAEPRQFYVYPPNNGTGTIEIVYSAFPTEVTSVDGALVVDDIYQTPVQDYVLYRAHQKDGDFSAGKQVADGYLATFTAFLQGVR